MDQSVRRSLLSDFMAMLDRGHPDLYREPLASFVRDVDDFSRAASICAAEGLDRPVEALMAAWPKRIPMVPSAARVLLPAHRQRARASKSIFWIDRRPLEREAARHGPDIPRSFDRPSSPRGTHVEPSLFWSAASERFGSIGCGSMAAAAKSLADEFCRDSTGLVRLPIRRAALILGNMLGAWDPGSCLKPFAAPAGSLPMPEWASGAMDASDELLAGHPAFDHHLVVAFTHGDSEPSPVEGRFVVLGERDGECYFLASN